MLLQRQASTSLGLSAAAAAPPAAASAATASAGPLAFQLPGELMVQQASLFLLRDGTLLSFFQSEGERVTGPLMDRLKVGGGGGGGQGRGGGMEEGGGWEGGKEEGEGERGGGGGRKGEKGWGEKTGGGGAGGRRGRGRGREGGCCWIGSRYLWMVVRGRRVLLRGL